MEEIFEIRSCTDISANDIKINAIEQLQYSISCHKYIISQGKFVSSRAATKIVDKHQHTVLFD